MGTYPANQVSAFRMAQQQRNYTRRFCVPNLALSRIRDTSGVRSRLRFIMEANNRKYGLMRKSIVREALDLKVTCWTRKKYMELMGVAH